MNKREHVLNAVLLSVGLGFLLRPVGDLRTFAIVAEVFVPVILGTLLPDVDTAFGTHRQGLHNVFVLGVIGLYPLYFGNLQWVWLGVVTHYVLDVLGTTRGIALFYPFSDREFDAPVGVPVDSPYADLVTLAVTALELAVAFLVLRYGTPVAIQATHVLAVQ